MRTVFLITALLICSLFIAIGQPSDRFVINDYQHFFKWFHQHSQVNQLYSNQSSLYIFGYQAQVHAAPNKESRVITQLQMGQSVQNIAHGEDYLPTDEINGYQDIWYQVTGVDPLGTTFRGFVWGSDIARGWRFDDITGDGQAEFVMLGISPRPRTTPENINAELRVLQNGRLIEQRAIPGLCVFEECGASPMLRIVKDSQNPKLILVEASTMTIGCNVGIEKVFLFWNGRQLERVFHAEYTTQTILYQKEFSFSVREDQTGAVLEVNVCHYSKEDGNFNPVWDCQSRMPEKALVPVIPVSASSTPKARAR